MIDGFSENTSTHLFDNDAFPVYLISYYLTKFGRF
jgi:hypothetical protein